jgi:hypothetical protein
MTRKEEEMRQNFVMKVREKEASLREREEQLNQRRQQLMAELEEQRLALAAEERELQEAVTQSKTAGYECWTCLDYIFIVVQTI